MSDAASPTEQLPGTISVLVKSSSGAVETVSGLDRASTSVADLKALLAARPSGVPAEAQRLIYKGRVMKDDMTLEHYDVTSGQTIHLVKSGASRDSTAATPAAAPAAAPTSAPAPSGTSGGAPGQQQPGFMFPGLSPFGAAAGDPFSSSSFSAASMQAQAQALMRDPEAARQIMNSPMMQSLMSNPDIIRDMISSNPQMQAMMDANPHMRHVLNDPALLRQTMEMMRSPAAMQEAMRHQDLALSNLENHPEGFNALRRMYEDIQEPMMDAAASARTSAGAPNAWMFGGGGSSTAGSPPPSSSSAPNTAALPNPWGAPSSSSATRPGAFPPASPLPPVAGAGLGSWAGQQPSAAQLGAMLQNPMMRQAMNEMMANPAMMSQMISADPTLRQMAASNPALGAMLADPELMRRMMDPQNMQAMLQMQQSMEQLQRSGLMPPGAFPGATPQPFTPSLAGAAGTSPIAGLDFSSLLAAAGTGGSPAPAPLLGGDPAVRFASQLRQLAEMGFTDQSANIRALTASGGNVNAAVERLLSGM